MTRKARPKTLSGFTYRIKTGCGTLYTTVNEDDGKVVEVFARMGKAGGCASSQIETMGRLISLGVRAGAPVSDIILQLQGISCHSPITVDDETTSSCADAMGKILRLHMAEREKSCVKGEVVKCG